MDNKINTFKIVEHHIGEKITEKSIPNLLKLNRDEYINLIEEIRFNNRISHWFADSGEIPRPKPTIRQAILTDSTGAINSFEIWDNQNKIKNLLLYYPTIAVLDPIDEILEPAAENPHIFIEQLIKLLPIRKLIDDRILDLVPAVTGKQAIREQIDLSGHLESILGCDELTDLLEAIKYYSPNNYSIVEQMDLELPGFALSEMERSVVNEIAHRKNGKVKSGIIILSAIIIKDLYIQNYISILNDCNIGSVSQNEINFFSKIGGLDFEKLMPNNVQPNQLPGFLLNVNVPQIENVSWQDIINLRNDDKDFYTWRKAMKDILNSSLNSGVYNNYEFLINSKEIMIANSRSLNIEIHKKQSIKSKVKIISAQTGIGFVGALLSGSLETAVLTSTISGALLFAYDMFSNKPSKGELALYRHFSLFV